MGCTAPELHVHACINVHILDVTWRRVGACSSSCLCVAVCGASEMCTCNCRSRIPRVNYFSVDAVVEGVGANVGGVVELSRALLARLIVVGGATLGGLRQHSTSQGIMLTSCVQSYSSNSAQSSLSPHSMTIPKQFPMSRWRSAPNCML